MTDAWTFLENVPKAQGSLTSAVSSKFVVVFDEKHHSLLAICGSKIFQYVFDENSWVQYKADCGDLREIDLSTCAVAMDCEQQKIFLNHKKQSIGIITLNDDNHQFEFETIDNLNKIGSGHDSKGVIINNEFHIIGGNQNKHCKYDPKSQNVQILHNFSDILKINSIRLHGIVRIKNRILMLGGDNGGSLNPMYEYHINNNEWNKLSIKLPTALSGFGCVPIINGQYVVLFGGCNYGNKKDIFIHCVRDGSFSKSKIKCPKGGHHQAFAIKNRKKDIMITSGFMRSINIHSFPPQDLMKIICDYYWNEWIHLFKIASSAGVHCKINVFKLFDV